MNDFFKVIGGIVTIIAVTTYFLAIFFAPFGIVWLILVH